MSQSHQFKQQFNTNKLIINQQSTPLQKIHPITPQKVPSDFINKSAQQYFKQKIKKIAKITKILNKNIKLKTQQKISQSQIQDKNISSNCIQSQFNGVQDIKYELSQQVNIVKKQIEQSLRRNGYLITITGIVKQLKDKGINRSITSIGRYLNKMGYVRKRIVSKPKDTQQSLQNIYAFASKMIKVPKQSIIFVDQLGYYEYRSIDFGWCQQHQKYPFIPQERLLIRDITIIASLSIQKILSFKIVKGDISKQILHQLLNQTTKQMKQNNQYILVDPSHIDQINLIKQIGIKNKKNIQEIPIHRIELNPLSKILKMIDNETRRKLDFYKLPLSEMTEFIMEYIKGIEFRIIEELYDRYFETISKNSQKSLESL